MKYLLFISYFFISFAQAEITLRQYNDRYCYDGDTCYVVIDGKNEKIRLLELDTPEISKPKCDAELELGLKARDFVNDLIKSAKTIEFKTDYELDYFGRILTYIIVDGHDVSSILVNNNLGKVYVKGSTIDWCNKPTN